MRVRCSLVVRSLLVVLALALSGSAAARPFLAAPAHAHPTAATPAGRSQTVAPGTTPDGLDRSAWTDIQTQVAAHAYRAFAANDGGYRSANAAQGWQIGYGTDGTTRLTPRAATAPPFAWGLRLHSYGYAQPVTLDVPQLLTPDGSRLTYQWDATLTEWWHNRADGLEQGWTLAERPAGGTPNEPLRLTLMVAGDLRAEPHGDGLAFVDARGATALTYGKLRAWDADGRTLPSQMTRSGNAVVLTVADAEARYPLTIDPTVQQAYLKANNTETGDLFGTSVAVAGDTVVVGAPGEASNATGVNGDGSNNSAFNAGAAYVFVRSGTIWAQQAYLKASNTGANDNFGFSVAVAGDTVVVGAFGEASNATGVNGDGTNNSATTSGAAYVFVRSGTSWTPQAYLKASNTGGSDQFGYAVAVAGDTVVVGAYGEASNEMDVNGNGTNNSAFSAGAAYVFVRSGTIWAQQAYLKASNTGAGDAFGLSVAVAGDTVVVGAYDEASNATGVNGNGTNNSANGAGAAYVFVRSGTSWTPQAYLKASNTEAGDYFGGSVAVAGDTVVVGAIGEASNAMSVNGNQTDNTATNSGAAYVFVRSGTTWAQQAYLKASNTGASDIFGRSVAVAGDTVVVGAYGEASNAMGVNGDGTNNSANDAGAAYVFVRSGTIWTSQAYLKASNTGAGDYFGFSVAVAGDTVVVGAYGEASNATVVDGNEADNSAGAAGATYVFTVPTAPTITSVAPPNGTYGAPYTVTVTASGSAPFTFSAAGLPPGLALDPASGLISGTPTQVGSFAVILTVSNGIAPDATQTATVVIAQAAQTITFALPPAKTFGDAPFNLSASASSGLAVTFSTSTPAVCTVSGNTVTLLAAGTCMLTASQPGNATFSAAAPVSQTFTVGKAAQTITFAALADKTVGEPAFGVSATASSALPVTLSTTTPTVCTVAGSTVTLLAAGTCTITASQAGDTNYSAAAPLTRSFTVAPASSGTQTQTITFAALPTKTVGDPAFSLSASASSGLAVTFSTSTPAVCTVAGITVTLEAAGTCTLTAIQAGDASFSAAAPVSQTLTVAQAPQTLTFAALPNKTVGDPAFGLSASASSGLVVTFSTSTPAVCTVTGSTVTLVAAGTCTLTATQGGNPNYSAAASVIQGFTVAPASSGTQPQTITFAALPTKTVGDAPFTLQASASSGLAVTFSTSTPQVCTVAGSTVTLLAAGTCTLTASQAGNASFSAAVPVSQTLTVAPASSGTQPQTITFAVLPTKTVGDAPFSVSASASSGLVVTFSTSTPTVCTVAGSTVMLLAAGTCTITASQAGDASFSAATPVTQSFTVAPVSSTRTLRVYMPLIGR